MKFFIVQRALTHKKVYMIGQLYWAIILILFFIEGLLVCIFFNIKVKCTVLIKNESSNKNGDRLYLLAHLGNQEVEVEVEAEALVLVWAPYRPSGKTGTSRT
jgi:hypothetical protein